MNIKLLETLYKTHSPSHHEDNMAALIKEQLDQWHIPYQQDKHLQIYNIVENAPIMVAHMDQVQKHACTKIMQVKNRIYGFNNKGQLVGLGADDKNGIFILLEMIKRHRNNLSFIFSACEEQGGKLRHLTKELDLSSTPYGLIFDRKGSSDIIGTGNTYCCEDLEVAIETIADGYKAAHGIFSDADELSEHVPCVNLSCGYYNAHTEEEYTKVGELFRAIQVADELLIHLPRKGKPYAMPEKWEHTTEFNYSKYGNVAYGWDSHGYPVGKKKKKKKSKVFELEPMPNTDEFYAVENGEDGVYFTVDSAVEEYLGEDMEDALGVWQTMYGELSIFKSKAHNTYVAYLGNMSIDIIGEEKEVTPMRK